MDAAIAGQALGTHGPLPTENGAHQWEEFAQATAEAAAKLGYLPEAKAEPLDLKIAKDHAGLESVSWGLKSRGRSERTRKIVGWNPSQSSPVNEQSEILRSE